MRLIRFVNAFVIAFSTYSRIPMPQVDWTDENRRYTMCFFPLVGAVVGLLLWGWLALCDALELGAMFRGAVGALIPLLLTGGIHMDGLMDTSDALASWQPRERRLEILKDTHTGAFAVMSCAGYLLLFAALLSEATATPALAMVFVISRALSAWTLAFFKSARPSGMLDGFARTAHRRMVTIASAVYVLLCLLVWRMESFFLLAACVLAAAAVLLYYRHMAYKTFGGVTGDLAGWFVQMMEIVLTAVIVMGGKSV